ncbi:MAG: tol-pal system-associated acyl-CoA thioesterase [Gammaproteobacteria bacterium]|nr:tol-pal system-associated acyl-CoA thioesterase [Gammaproteobacteria bacterium]
MTFSWPVRVYYEDTDAGGVVYYANYLKFMERARTEWLRQLGFEQDDLRQRDGVLFIVQHVDLDYLKPGRFNDLLQVSVRIRRRGRASMELAQEVTRSPGELLCSGMVRIVCVDAASLRPRPVPADVLKEIKLAD